MKKFLFSLLLFGTDIVAFSRDFAGDYLMQIHIGERIFQDEISIEKESAINLRVSQTVQGVFIEKLESINTEKNTFFF